MIERLIAGRACDFPLRTLARPIASDFLLERELVFDLAEDIDQRIGRSWRETAECLPADGFVDGENLLDDGTSSGGQP